MAEVPRSVGEVPQFIEMLRVACENRMVHDKLDALLSMPNARRQGIVHAWVNDLLIAEAPGEFIAAIACLKDDAVAEKAYEVIFQCARRGGHGSRMS